MNMDFEQYDLDDIDAEVIEAFIEAFLDRDAFAMREVLYLIETHIKDLYESPEYDS
tara:strand:- start:80 stop:247 length:168 start_codon:yes stop_codon:yes gene_type:complete